MDIEKILAMLTGERRMVYRERLDRRHPEVHQEMVRTASDILEKYETLSTGELTEYIRSEFPHPVTDGLIGLISAVEILSKGEMSSRPEGPTPVNVVLAFAYWLFENPEIESSFRTSDRYQELCDSGHEGFEWPDKYEVEVPNPMIFGGGNDDTPTPGNYL